MSVPMDKGKSETRLKGLYGLYYTSVPLYFLCLISLSPICTLLIHVIIHIMSIFTLTCMLYLVYHLSVVFIIVLSVAQTKLCIFRYIIIIILEIGTHQSKINMQLIYMY